MTLIDRCCCVCKIVKPISEFGPHKKNPSGFQYECRPCVNAKVKAYMAGLGDAYKEKKRAYDKARVTRLKEQLSEKNRIRYLANREARINATKEWCANNRERSAITKSHYKHRRRQIEGEGVSHSEFMKWKSLQEKKCHWCDCDCSASPVVDHYFPLSKGGKHELSNLVISCRSCNARKSNKLPDRFLSELVERSINASFQQE